MSFVDKLYEIKNSRSSTGDKIKTIRDIKNISTRALGDACSVNVNTIRNYELGNRQVNEEKLNVIAEFLGVNVSALYDRKIVNYVDAMHTLFELQRWFDLVPSSTDTEPHCDLKPNDETLLKAIQAWMQKRSDFEQKKITKLDLLDWELSFPEKFKEESLPQNKDVDIPDASEDFDRSTAMKLALAQIKFIVTAHTDHISKLLGNQDIEQAKFQTVLFQRMIEGIIDADIAKFG